jgi:hypothetical protein
MFMGEVKDLTKQLTEAVRIGELDTRTALEQFNKITPTQLSTGRIYTQKSVEQRREKYEEARRIRQDIKKARIPFISRHFLPHFYLAQGLTVVGAESGKAKSTTCSNLLYGFLTTSDKKAIVISNEEATDAIYERTACIALKKDYTKFFSGQLPQREENEIIRFVTNEIIPRVEVVEDGTFDMSYLEDVQAVLDSAANNKDGSDTGIVLIDYLQIITQSRKEPNIASFEVSKKLGLYLKSYGKQNAVPVVCFVQLHSSTRGPTMAERVQNDKTFYNHGFACIEIVPNFETLSTEFKVHKDRFFGSTGKVISCAFEGGRYIFEGEESL